MSTTALILAAGRGSRLRPYTDHAPKCLVELAGQSLLAHQWQALRHEGIDNIQVITGYRAADIEALGYPTVHNPSFATTNMVATLFCAWERMVDTADLLIDHRLLRTDELAPFYDPTWPLAPMAPLVPMAATAPRAGRSVDDA